MTKLRWVVRGMVVASVCAVCVGCAQENEASPQSPGPNLATQSAALSIDSVVSMLRSRVGLLEKSVSALGAWKLGADSSISGLLGTVASLSQQVQDLTATVAALTGQVEDLQAAVTQLQGASGGHGALQVVDAGGHSMGQFLDFNWQPTCDYLGFPVLPSCNTYVVYNGALGFKFGIRDYYGGLGGNTYFKFPDCQGAAYFSPSSNNILRYEGGQLLAADWETGSQTIAWKSYRQDGGDCTNNTGNVNAMKGIPIENPPFPVPLQLPFHIE